MLTSKMWINRVCCNRRLHLVDCGCAIERCDIGKIILQTTWVHEDRFSMSLFVCKSYRDRVWSTKSLSGMMCEISNCSGAPREMSKEARNHTARNKLTMKQRRKGTDCTLHISWTRHVAVFTNLWPCCALSLLLRMSKLVSTFFVCRGLGLGHMFTHC